MFDRMSKRFSFRIKNLKTEITGIPVRTHQSGIISFLISITEAGMEKKIKDMSKRICTLASFILTNTVETTVLIHTI